MIRAENKSHISEDVCFYVTVDNHPWAYLFDCGKARYLGVGDCKSLRAIFITHTHIDHFCNFDTLLRHQLGCKHLITICGPVGIAKNVQAKVHSYTWNLIRPKSMTYRIEEIDDDQITSFEIYPPHWKLIKKGVRTVQDQVCFKEDGIHVKYAVLDHKIPSLAFSLEEESHLNIQKTPYLPGPWIRELKEAYVQKKVDQAITVQTKDGPVDMKAESLFHFLYEKAGKKLGYAMDHMANESNHKKMIELWKNADEVIIEGYFRDCDRPYALRHYHSTVKESGKVARLSGAKKMTLTHHSRRYLKELDDLREEGYAAFEGREPKYKLKPVSRYQESEEEEGIDV